MQYALLLPEVRITQRSIELGPALVRKLTTVRVFSIGIALDSWKEGGPFPGETGPLVERRCSKRSGVEGLGVGMGIGSAG